MTRQLPATVLACSEYQRLLEESSGAREARSTFRIKRCGAQVIPEETIRELLRLQAKYARAYALLQNHVRTCGRCGPALKTA
jgi:hypothetical protein